MTAFRARLTRKPTACAWPLSLDLPRSWTDAGRAVDEDHLGAPVNFRHNAPETPARTVSDDY